MGTRQKTIELDIQVKNEVIGHRRVTNQQEFLDMLLPCKVDPKMIFKSIREENYNGGLGLGSWKQLPKTTKIKKRLYDPFVRIATAIQDSSVQTLYNSDPGHAENENTHVQGSWVNCANKLWEESARVRPDIGLYTGTQQIQALRDDIIRERKKEVGKSDLRTLERQRTREVLSLIHCHED